VIFFLILHPDLELVVSPDLNVTIADSSDLDVISFFFYIRLPFFTSSIGITNISIFSGM
jgi:hypothetical protein